MHVDVARRDAAAVPSARASIDAVGAGLQATIDELRRLVHGVMPAALVERGLVAAIEDLVDRVPLPVRLDLPPAERSLPPLAESTAYFVVAEGLSNALKYAKASMLDVRLDRVNGRLEIEVRDDGVGGARGARWVASVGSPTALTPSGGACNSTAHPAVGPGCSPRCHAHRDRRGRNAAA